MSDIEAQIITQPIIEAENIAPEENKCYRFLYMLFIILGLSIFVSVLGYVVIVYNSFNLFCNSSIIFSL